MSINSDFSSYIADMRVIQSHLEAANKTAIGIFQSNPLSRGLPCFDDLAARLSKIQEKCREAEWQACQKFADHLREGSE